MTEFGEADISRVRGAVADLVDEYSLPGIAVGVVSGDRLVYAEGFGLADIETGRPQDPSLRQRIGSITKTMVALCAMRLVDEGRLSLDDRVVDRLPDLRLDGPAESLRISHLLTHTGGIGEAPTIDDFPDPWSALWSDEPDLQGVPGMYPRGITIEAPPGTRWAYANHGFALLGEIVGRAEEMPIERVLESRVFGPLGMEHSDCLDMPSEELTTGYHRAPDHDERDVFELISRDFPEEATADGHNIRGRYQHVRTRAAGAVQSTIPDMARYASALLRRGSGIVQPATFDLMTEPHWCPDERMVNVGLCFMRSRRFGRATFGHGGGIVGGWNTQLVVVPEEDLALLVHLNLWYDGFGGVADRVLQAVLDAPTATVLARPTQPEVLAAAPGVYEPAPGHLTSFRIVRATGRVQVTARDGELFLRSRRGPWREGVRMVSADPADPAIFALDTGGPEPSLVALVRDASGAVTGVRFDRMVELVRNEALEPWA